MTLFILFIIFSNALVSNLQIFEYFCTQINIS